MRQFCKKEKPPPRLTAKCKICKKRVYVKYMERHVGLHAKDTCTNSTMILDSQTGEFSCNICNRKFQTELEYLWHGRYGNRMKGLPQNENKRVTETLRKSLEPKYSCKVCGKQYLSRILRDHMNTHNNQKPYMCDLCGKRFSFRSNFLFHYRSHQLTGILCDICGKMYKTNRELNAHVNWKHLGVFHNDCQVCGKAFPNAYRLRMHMRYHTGEKPHSCTNCDASFTQRTHLQTHVKEHHSEDRPFVCEICPKSFAVKYKLNYHMKIHGDCESKVNIQTSDGERKLETYIRRRKCQTCNQRCKVALYNEHVKLHSEGHLHVCSSCNTVFSGKNTLRYHKLYVCRRQSETAAFCDICNKNYRSRAAVAIHRRSHTGEKPYTCEECGKTFSQRAHLSTHSKLHTGVKEFECPYCQKQFTLKGNLKQHIMTHTGETPFKCDICSKGFVTSSTLRKHQSVHRN